MLSKTLHLTKDVTNRPFQAKINLKNSLWRGFVAPDSTPIGKGQQHFIVLSLNFLL